MRARSQGLKVRAASVKTFRVRVDQMAELLAVATRQVALERGARLVAPEDVIAASDRLLRAHDLLAVIRASLLTYMSEVEDLEGGGLRQLLQEDAGA
jgi:hypothetical protein